jgi:endonuclease III
LVTQAQASHRKKEVALTLSSLETFSGQSSLFLSQQLVTKQEHKVMEELRREVGVGFKGARLEVKNLLQAKLSTLKSTLSSETLALPITKRKLLKILDPD